MEDIVKIPVERVAVLIGKQGKTKKKIEEMTQVVLNINSSTGEVLVKGNQEKDPINFYNALNIIKAIGRGFSPKNAFLLLDDNYILDVIKVTDIVGKSEKAVSEKKGRVIGKEGKARSEIEAKTNTVISVYGKTVSIIGEVNNLEIARKAVEMLLEGATHATVFNFLKRKTIEAKKFRI